MQNIQTSPLARLYALVCVVVLLGVSCAHVPAIAKENPKYASIVIDADTGQVLSQDRATKKLHPASLTKAMTLLLAFESIENGQNDYNSPIRMSKHAASMVPSKLDLKPGSTIRMKDAIYALVTKSANDVAVAMAEHLGGSEYRFARQMTAKAKAIGMSDTQFKNASGLHHPEQVTTARDMAKMASYIINKYPTYYRFFSTKEFTYRGKTYRNHNRLMQTYEGMDGLKTGYINASGFNLVASAKRGDRRLIGVVFGGRTSQSRNTHMADLLDRAFGKRAGTKRNANYIATYKAAPAPIPTTKPGIVTAMNSSEGIVNTIKKNIPDYRWMALGPDGSKTVVEQGDTDPDVYRQIREFQKAPVNQNSKSALINSDGWAIQVGAFSSRAKTDRALNKARRTLPDHLVTARASIAPLKTDSGWLFRARLSGYTKAEADEACSQLSNCMTIAPANY